jgi:hypothetical protein
MPGLAPTVLLQEHDPEQRIQVVLPELVGLHPLRPRQGTMRRIVNQPPTRLRRIVCASTDLDVTCNRQPHRGWLHSRADPSDATYFGARFALASDHTLTKRLS